MVVYTDLLVVTEGVAEVFPRGGHTTDAGTDWGYSVKNPERRKVLLRSRYPLHDIEADVDLPTVTIRECSVLHSAWRSPYRGSLYTESVRNCGRQPSRRLHYTGMMRGRD